MPMDGEGVPEVRLWCAVIHCAASDARGGSSSAARFFSDKRSPFWEYCEHIGMDAKMIADRVLFDYMR